VTESCLRCGAPMEWRHQTWQCPRCRFKIGCCEGDAGCEVEADIRHEGGRHRVPPLRDLELGEEAPPGAPGVTA